MNLTKIKAFSVQHWFPVAGFFLALGTTLWFGFTFLADAIYFNDPRHKDETLKGWMTPRYVVMSYELPRELVLETFGISNRREGGPIRLSDIAEDRDMTVEELTDEIRRVAEEYRTTEE